jgi:hypothetical protein
MMRVMRLVIVVWGVVLGVLAAVASCKGKDDAARAAADTQCRDAVADGQVAEARAWLDPSQTAGHAGFELDLAETREIVDALYAAGAPRVQIGYADVEGAQVSSHLVVDLPPRDAAARGAVFAYHASIRERLELDAAKDVGQACLVIGLD